MKALVGHLFAGDSPQRGGSRGSCDSPRSRDTGGWRGGPGLSAAIHPDGAPAGIRDQDAARVREIVG